MTEPIDETKRRLRTEMRARRAAVSDRVTRTRAVLDEARRLIEDLAPAPPRVIGGYLGIGTELDPRALLETMAAGGDRIALPVATAGEALIFRAWTPGEALRTGAFDVSEPADGPIVEPDVLLVPLLAFDDVGGRLGQGGGHYDRTIAARPHVPTIGLAFTEQRIELVPHGRFDRTLSAVAVG